MPPADREPRPGRRRRGETRLGEPAPGRSPAVAVGGGCIHAEINPRRQRHRPPSRPAPDHLDGIAQRRDADRLDPVGETGFLLDDIRDDDPPQSPPRERGRHRQDPGHRPNLSAERQLADQRDPTGRRPNLLRPEQDPHRDREVERRAGLALLGRREVDRDPARRMDEPRVPDRASDPLARLLERGVREPDDREPRQPSGDVHLDADDPAVEADDGCGQEGREHSRTVVGRRSPRAQPPISCGSPGGRRSDR